MSLLKNLTTDASIADEKDSLGGGLLDSGLYLATIKHAYITTAGSGALGLVFQAQTESGSFINETMWMTSGTAKGSKNYYVDKQGIKHYLPGFMNANALALLTVGQEIGNLETEEKVVSTFNKEANAKVPTKVQMFADLVGKQVALGIVKETVDKTEKNDAGVYVPNGETRDQNVIDKVFRAEDNKTTAEIRAAADATFFESWKAKWDGKVKDSTKKVDGKPAAKAFGGTAANTATKKPTTSLFSAAA